MTLLLDPDIRDWVVLPLFVIMVLTGLLRQSVGILFMNGKSKTPYIAQRAQNKLIQTTRCIKTSASHYITTNRYNVRKMYAIEILQREADWVEQEKIKLDEMEQTTMDGDGDSTSNSTSGNGNNNNNNSNDPMADMMANPMKMMGGNMFFMVQNMVMMQGIQHFFSGFILLKVPFPLTVGFKNMFQRGVMDMPDLQPSYVSSVSWYFLVMYGLRSFLMLLMGKPTLEQREYDTFAEKIGLQNPSPTGSVHKHQEPEAITKMLRQEAENIELFVQHHKSDIDTVEKRLLGKSRYPKRNITTEATNNEVVDFLFGIGASSKSISTSTSSSSNSNNNNNNKNSSSKKKKKQ